MSAERLSALDAVFLAVERPVAPMHVGWVALFDPPEEGRRPSAREIVAHLAARLDRAPRYRQRLAGVPFGLHEPEWVDDPAFDVRAHLHVGRGPLDALADRVLSTPLDRERPLWEMWVSSSRDAIAIVGKAHHCMVDGVAAMQLGELVMDRDANAGAPRGATTKTSAAAAATSSRTATNGAPPGAAASRPNGSSRSDGSSPGDGSSAPSMPSFADRLGRAALDRATEGATVALAPFRFVSSPLNVFGLPAGSVRAARAVAHAVLPPAPDSPLNLPGSPARRLVRLTRPLDDVRAVRKRFGVTPNDVVLAAAAGGLRRFAERRGDPPRRLKAMVPADVRAGTDAPGGNRISFLFIELPCDEPDPIGRLMTVHAATSQRERDGEAEAVDAALRALAHAPRTVQRTLAQAVAHPRFFNLVVSSIPGPAVPRYLRGCRLRAIHPAVPLADRHALSIGVVTVAGRACFGLYADAATLPDADALAADLDAAFEELSAQSSP
jgi:diacylglycerol O-acyltransferase